MIQVLGFMCENNSFASHSAAVQIKTRIMYNKRKRFCLGMRRSHEYKREVSELNEITSGNPLLSSIRSIVETTFYGNNVHEVFDRKTAYQLAKGVQERSSQI